MTCAELQKFDERPGIWYAPKTPLAEGRSGGCTGSGAFPCPAICSGDAAPHAWTSW